MGQERLGASLSAADGAFSMAGFMPAIRSAYQTRMARSVGAAPIRSNITPPLRAACDRNEPRQKCSQERDDHCQSDLIRLQPFALPFQEYRKRKSPTDADFGIELPAQVRNHAVKSEQVTHQPPKRGGEDGRNRAP